MSATPKIMELSKANRSKGPEKLIIRETLTSIKRAGADMIITYFAVEAVEKGYLED